MFTRSTVLSTVLFGLVMVVGTAEGTFFSPDNLMPATQMLSTPTNTIVDYQIGASHVWVRNFTVNCVGTRVHPVGDYRIDSFFDIFTEVSTDGGVNWLPNNDLSVSGSMQFHERAAPLDFFDTEMLNLGVSGPAAMLRESPTLVSAGQTTIESFGLGYHVDSFFDVFTEMSLNGGMTWSPATQISIDGGKFWIPSATVRLQGVPEPGALVLLTTGCAALLLWRRRNRQSA